MNHRYDSVFSDEELKRIRFLRRLNRDRTFLTWLAGITTTATIFLIQIPFHGNSLLHAFCSYGSLPAGIGIGFWAYSFIDRYTDTEFLTRWDQLFYQRSNTSPELLEAQNEVSRLTDDMFFICLPLERQRLAVNEIYRKRGLPVPNPVPAESSPVRDSRNSK